MPRSTRQAWLAYHDRLDACPPVGAFCHSGPGLACLHRLVLAFPLMGVEVGACGIGLVGRVVELTGLNRFVGASSGTPQQGKRRVAEAIVAYRQEEHTRRAHEMPAKESTMTPDATLTGGLCRVGREPMSTSLVWEQVAQAHAQDPWQARMAQALSGLNGQGMPSTRDAAPGLLASVAHPLGAHHAPDVCRGQPAWRTAVSAPMAVTQRAADQAAVKAHEGLKRVHEQLDTADDSSAPRGPGRPPQGVASLEQVAQEAAAACHEPQRLAGQRETRTYSLRAIGHADHCVELQRGVCAPAGAPTRLGAARVLRHARPSPALMVSRARCLDADRDSGRAAARACRAPSPPAVRPAGR